MSANNPRLLIKRGSSHLNDFVIELLRRLGPDADIRLPTRS